MQWKCLRSLAAFVLSAALMGAAQRHSNPVQISADGLVVAANLGLFFLDWKRPLLKPTSGHGLANESPALSKSHI